MYETFIEWTYPAQYGGLDKLMDWFIHAFVLGLLGNLRSVYEIRSNVESGYGRADSLMIPKTSRYTTGNSIGFKSIDQAEDLKDTFTHALNQIHDNADSAAVHNTGVLPDQVRSLAIILNGKRSWMEKKNNVKVSYEPFGSHLKIKTH